MRHYGLDKAGQRLGVLGLGGLGHMAVKFGKAFGQHVTVISRSDAKKQVALDSLGADDFVATSDPDAIKAVEGKFDGIIDTVSAKHDINQALNMLKRDGKLIFVGVPDEPNMLSPHSIVWKRRVCGGSLVGSLKETREMLNLCAEKGIRADVEVIDANYVNEAFERMFKGDVKFRFVIDVQGSIILNKK
jgi:D-arabinose 1-dehydrogenase-like Zn-dependent alcohol dehydrogenase